MIFKTPEQYDEDRYCNSTPIGEKWPICNLYKGHMGMHESADFKWANSGPAIMKCNSTPLGEKWPICNLYKDHKGMHESADFKWADSGPAIMKLGDSA